MAEQPVVEMLLTTEVKSLQVKLKPHQEQFSDTNSKTPQKDINYRSSKNSYENKFFKFFLDQTMEEQNAPDGKAEVMLISQQTVEIYNLVNTSSVFSSSDLQLHQSLVWPYCQEESTSTMK